LIQGVSLPLKESRLASTPEYLSCFAIAYIALGGLVAAQPTAEIKTTINRTSFFMDLSVLEFVLVPT
jgi:hypothetical protein